MVRLVILMYVNAQTVKNYYKFNNKIIIEKMKFVVTAQKVVIINIVNVIKII